MSGALGPESLVYLRTRQFIERLFEMPGTREAGSVDQLARRVHLVHPAGETKDLAIRLPQRPAFVAGRESLLSELDARLKDAADQIPPVVALCGLGGTGKTSVALEYAYRHLAGLGVAWVLEAEEPTSLAAGFRDLAAQLGVRGVWGVRGVRDAGDPVDQVHGALAGRSGDWLLIFDNAPGPGALQRMIPPKGRGQVIITSQNPHWQPDQAINVLVLEPDVAASFIQARTGSADRDVANKLATELDGLPLALEQACAFIRTTGDSAADYLALFQHRRADLLARGEPAGYGKQVATTWKLAFDQLQEDSPRAVAMLRLLSCCAPERIPYRLLLRPLPGLPDVPQCHGV